MNNEYNMFFNKKGTTHDNTKDFLRHKETVVKSMLHMIDLFRQRALEHDNSKLTDIEKQMYHNLKDNLKDIPYASEKYNEIFEKLKSGLDHHYVENRHHPEHFKDGMHDMNVLDLSEMVCDWSAYAKRSNTNIYEVIEAKQQKYGFSDDLKDIIINTVEEIIANE